jgi:AraC family transcriptional regulator
MTMPAEARVLDAFDGGPPGAQLPATGKREIARPTPLPSAQPCSHDSIMQVERNWRQPEILTNGSAANLRLFAARWTGSDLREKTSEIAGDYHMLSVSLQPTEFSIRLGNKTIPNKQVIPGTMQLTAPAVPARIVYHKSYDVLHVFMQHAFLKEFFEWFYSKPPVGDVVLRDPDYAHDPLIGRLAVALLSADEIGGAYGELYAGSLSMAIVARLFSLYAERPAPAPQRSIAALPKWRLKRVTEFIDTHADESITLTKLAQVAGLSRMHFAAQFRRATGLRPHDFLLQQRIEKAKTMLQTTNSPIVEISLATGFSCQSHFTVVFKRFTGATPHRWRESSRP